MEADLLISVSALIVLVLSYSLHFLLPDTWKHGNQVRLTTSRTTCLFLPLSGSLLFSGQTGTFSHSVAVSNGRLQRESSPEQHRIQPAATWARWRFKSPRCERVRPSELPAPWVSVLPAQRQTRSFISDPGSSFRKSDQWTAGFYREPSLSMYLMPLEWMFVSPD